MRPRLHISASVLPGFGVTVVFWLGAGVVFCADPPDGGVYDGVYEGVYDGVYDGAAC